MYEPEDDPFLMSDDIEDPGDSPEPKPQPNQPKGKPKPGPYQYQPHQSMYNMSPLGGTPPAGGFPGPGPAPPRFPVGPGYGPGYGPGVMPPPGPGLRPTASFYGDPNMPQPYMMPPQPYGMTPPVMIPPPQPIYASPPAVYSTAATYRDRNAISEQIEAMQQYERSRPPSYGSNSADNSLLIATLVSEQDALYGTNMLENITPADDEYIRSLRARGVPEHEALRMAFDRKPHPPRPRKPVSQVDSAADAQALEQAIQLSLTESSRRASQPSYSSGFGATSNDLADQEALETAIQLSLSEAQAQQQRYRQYEQDYSTGSYYRESEDRRYDQSYESSARRYSGEDRGYDYVGGDHRRGGYEADLGPVPTTFDRQYPYNLTREDPDEVLHKNYTVSNVDKYRLAQQQQQDYLNHLQSSGALDAPPTRHHHTHTEEYDHYSRETTARTSDVVREAEELRARAYGRGGPRDPTPPSTYRESVSSLAPVPGYVPRGKEGGYDAFESQHYQEHHSSTRYSGDRRYDEDGRSQSSRGREYAGDDRYEFGGVSQRQPPNSRGAAPEYDRYGRDDGVDRDGFSPQYEDDGYQGPPPPHYAGDYSERVPPPGYDRYGRAASPDDGVDREGFPPQYEDDGYQGPPPPHYAGDYSERVPPPGYDRYGRAASPDDGVDRKGFPPQYEDDGYQGPPPPHYAGDYQRAPPPVYGGVRGAAHGSRADERYDTYAREDRYEQYGEDQYGEERHQQATLSAAYAPSNQGRAPLGYTRNDGDSDSEGQRKLEEMPRLQGNGSARNVTAANVIRAENIANTATSAVSSDRPVRVLTRAPSARELQAPDTARSATPPTAVAPPAYPALHQRGLQQVKAAQTTSTTTTSVEHSAATSTRAAASAQLQRPVVPPRPPQLTAPPTLTGRPPLSTSASMRVPPSAVATAEDPPPEFAEDDDAAFAKKHEWRKTLKNLVNDLTAPSDDSYQSK